MIRLCDVQVRAGGVAILEVDALDIGGGEFVAVVGPNGAGKSTLLSVMAGLTGPDSGSVTLGEVSIEKMPRSALARLRSHLGADSVTDLWFSVQQVVEMGLHPWSTATYEGPHVDEVLDRLDLTALADRPLASLSTGEARRAHLARLVVQNTPLWLLDEPMAGLDIAHEERAHRLLKEASNSGRTVVAVIHDLNTAMRHADRVLVMSSGRIVADGTPVETMRSEMLSTVFGHPIVVDRHPDNDVPLITPR